MKLLELFEAIDAGAVGDIQAALRQRYGIHLDLRMGRDGIVDLEGIQASKDAKPGTGTAAMEDLVRWADQNGVMLTLQFGEKGYEPVAGWKKTSSQARLKKFYARFGFKPNKGRYKRFDLSLYTSMYREPRKLTEAQSFPNWVGWTNIKTGETVSGTEPHYTYLRQHAEKMGIPANQALDSYHGPSQMAAYEQGWMRWFFWDQGHWGSELYLSGTKQLLDQPAAKRLAHKLIQQWKPSWVNMDLIDRYGKVEGLNDPIEGTDRGKLRKWFDAVERFEPGEDTRLYDPDIAESSWTGGTGDPRKDALLKLAAYQRQKAYKEVDPAQDKRAMLTKNPSPQQVMAIAQKGAAEELEATRTGDAVQIKGLLNPTTGDFWVWNPNFAIHGDIDEYLVGETGKPKVRDWVTVTGGNPKEDLDEYDSRYVPYSGVLEADGRIRHWMPYLKATRHPNVLRALKGTGWVQEPKQ